MGVENLFSKGLNGFVFSLMGMTIVFSGLAIICLYVAILPGILDFLKKIKKIITQKTKPSKQNGLKKSQLENDSNEIDIMMAIAAAYHLEESMMADNQKITWKKGDESGHDWKMAGKMKSFSMR